MDVWQRALAHLAAHEARPAKPWQPRQCDVCGQQIERAPGARGPHPSKHRNCSLLLARLGQVERAASAVEFSRDGQALAQVEQLVAAILAAPTLPASSPTRAAPLPRRASPAPSPSSPACCVCGKPTPSRRAKACGPACAAWTHRLGEAARLLPRVFGHDHARTELLRRVVALAECIEKTVKK